MLTKLLAFGRQLGLPVSQKATCARGFSPDQTTGLSRRTYRSYSDYVEHQRAKLRARHEEIAKYDLEYERIVAERYQSLVPVKGRRVLCLAARLGGEVRAFKSLGALAVGIDLEPGADNEHVLHGDFHEIAFPDGVFDIAFTNALDHVLELRQLLSEVCRVLSGQGLFLVELADVQPSAYEVLDVKDVKRIEEIFAEGFVVEQKISIKNETDFTTWCGTLYFLRKRGSESPS